MISRQKEDSLYWRWVWPIVGFGATLRLWQYLFNRSLWYDEAVLALNILGRSFAGILDQLDYRVVQPIGFLLIEKSAVTLLGNNEYALRLWPLLTALLALMLFPFVARRCCGVRAALIAVTLFAISDRVIYYSSEARQYSSDVALTLAIFLMVLCMEQGGLRKRNLILLGTIGAVSLWLSYSVCFTLLGALIVTALLLRVRKCIELFKWFVFTCSMLLVSGSLCAILSLPQLAVRDLLVDDWQSSLAPFPFSSLTGLMWYFRILPTLMRSPGGFSFCGLALFAAIIGGLSMARNKKCSILLLLLAPILFALIASGLKVYPFSGRLMLFAVPSALLLIGEGIDGFIRAPSRLLKTGGIMLLCLLILSPLRDSVKSLFQPRSGPCGPAEMRPVIEYIKARREPGDIIYVHHNGGGACNYYLYGQDFAYIGGIRSYDSAQKYIEEIESLRGNQRVWFAFTRAFPYFTPVQNERRFFVDYLDRIGERKDSYRIRGGAAYLYDLSMH